MNKRCLRATKRFSCLAYFAAQITAALAVSQTWPIFEIKTLSLSLSLEINGRKKISSSENLSPPSPSSPPLHPRQSVYSQFIISNPSSSLILIKPQLIKPIHERKPGPEMESTLIKEISPLRIFDHDGDACRVNEMADHGTRIIRSAE